MELEKIFQSRKFGINLDECIAIICGVSMAEWTTRRLIPTDGEWHYFAIYVAGWIAGFIIYQIIRLIVVKAYYKICPSTTKKEEFEEIFKENKI